MKRSLENLLIIAALLLHLFRIGLNAVGSALLTIATQSTGEALPKTALRFFLAVMGDQRLLSFFSTAILLIGPILIYRFVIRRTALHPADARKAARLYVRIAIPAAIVCMLLLRSRLSITVAPLWASLGYRILRSGYLEEEPILQEGSLAAPSHRSCTKCEAIVSPNSLYCPVCGAKTKMEAQDR